jgi:hypothetical protein
VELGRLDPALENARYLQQFRVSLRTFCHIFNAIKDHPHMNKQDTHFRKAVPARKRLALTLHWLARAQGFNDLGTLWGIGDSTANVIVHEVLAVLDSLLPTNVIQFPVGAELARVMLDFENLHGLPWCAGAIDGSFIPMKCPPGVYGYKYWCYKNIYATLLLALVDSTGLFRYINTNTAASVGDAAVFARSKLLRYIDNESWLPSQEGGDVMGTHVRPYIIGDAAFPLRPYLMKCFAGDPHTETLEGWFNYNIIRTRRVVENAFGRLKARFHVLTATKLDNPVLMGRVIRICCALHNICQLHNDPFDDDWAAAHLAGEYNTGRVGGGGRQDGAGVAGGQAVRAALAEYCDECVR